jgi:hypothetical protein
MRRATLRLTTECDNRCVFCAQRGTAGAALDVIEADEVTLVGGEPLLVEKLPEIIAAARKKYSAVGIQTNGRRLAERIGELDGLSDVHLSLHGATAAVHDYHTGVDGSFVESLAGLAAVRARGIEVVVTTVLTRSNFRSLAEMPALLASRGVAAWHIAVPSIAGEAARGFDRIAPRLGMALPFALHALAGAAQRRIPTFVSGAPLCLLGTFASRALDLGGGAFGAACDGCAARARCRGVDPAYLARFSGDELSPRDMPAEAPHPLMRLFVGAGELVPVDIAKAAPKSLPVLRAQPARAEVSAAAPKKTGEALREILPGLFEK